MLGRRRGLAGEPQAAVAIEPQRDRGDLVVDVVVADLAAGAAADDMGLAETSRAVRGSARRRRAPRACRNTARDRRRRTSGRRAPAAASRPATIAASASTAPLFRPVEKSTADLAWRVKIALAMRHAIIRLIDKSLDRRLGRPGRRIAVCAGIATMREARNETFADVDRGRLAARFAISRRMNVFHALHRPRPLGRDDAGRGRRFCRRRPICPASWSSRRARRAHGDHGHQCGDGAGQGRRQEAARAGRGDRRPKLAQATRWSPRSRSPGRASSI